MTDTAEYWNDIKSAFSNSKHVFTHAKGFDCGHFHVHETSLIESVDCYACLEKMPESMKIEFTANSENKKKQKLHWDKVNSIKKRPNNPVCNCGYGMVSRTNGKGEKFFGCSQYPKCKCTKSIAP